jgi:hypothetical protein
VAGHLDKNRQLAQRLCALLLAATAAFVLASPASAVTGDPAAIAAFDKVARGYLKLQGARAIETGMFFLHYNGGSSVDYRWGADPPPAFVPAKATIDYWLSEGQIVGYHATVKAPKIPTLRILVAAGNVFTSTSKCWERADEGSAPFGTGERYLLNYGNVKFDKLKRSGRSTIVTFRYLWLEGTNAKETVTMAGGKTPKLHSRIELKGKSSLKIDTWITPLKKAPELPLVSQRPPKAPEPRPICKPT